MIFVNKNAIELEKQKEQIKKKGTNGIIDKIN